MDSNKLIRALWKKYPRKVAEKYGDFVGSMVNKLKPVTNKIVVCLDVSPEVIKKAKEVNADLIISHHPFIYGMKRDVLKNPYKKNMYDELVSLNIPVYSFHTNFDESNDGMNDALVEALKLTNTHPFKNVPMGRMGELPTEMTSEEFTKYALNMLDIDYGLIIGDKTKMIKKIGIIGGGGSREFNECFKEGIDLYISGDTPYHIRKEILDRGLTYLHLDHEIEKIFIKQIKKVLLEINNTLEIIEVNDVKMPTLITRF